MKVDAVEARREVDLRIGAAFTRFQTIMLQDRFASFDRKVVSFGPCQFPTLGFVVDRFKQIRDFVVEPFWAIRLSYTGQTDTSAAASNAPQRGSF
jgi:DNA topoisomerase-3